MNMKIISKLPCVLIRGAITSNGTGSAATCVKCFPVPVGFRHSHFRPLGTSAEKITAPTFREKIKLVWKKYGLVALGTHFSIYLATIGSLYVALDVGVFNAATFGFNHEAAILEVILEQEDYFLNN
jgi:uracil-DNA glycosylase